MSNWSKYESHMVVQAARIVNLVGRPAGLGRSQVLEITVQPDLNAPTELFVPNVPGAFDRAEVGGWAVIRDDGSRDTLPARTFEADYLKSDDAPKAPVAAAPLPAPTVVLDPAVIAEGRTAKLTGKPREVPPELVGTQPAAWLKGWDETPAP